MAPLAPTVKHFPEFCLQKKIPNKCSIFFFGGTPGGGGGGVQKIFSADFFLVAPWAMPSQCLANEVATLG